jgi:hypothetical protein
VKRLLREVVALGWSVVGAGFVLMTVSGSVFRTGMVLTLTGVCVQLLGLLLKENDDE